MNKTLVIITPGFPVNEADTCCIPPQQVFVKALKENNPLLNIIVVTFQYPFLSKRYLWHGIQVISLGGKNKGNIFRIFLWLKAWQVLKQLKNENQLVGLLSFWLGECAFIGKWFAQKNNIKHYCWLLGQDAKAGNRYFTLIKPNAEKLVAISDFVATQLYNNYAVHPQHIIPVGVDRSMFERIENERNIDVLAAGSLIILKQYHLFIHVIAELKKTFPNIRTVLCGDGPELEKIQQLITTLDLNKNIVLKGEIPHTEVLHLMQHSKLFLHTSLYEGFSTVCAEALYAGAWVISFCKPMKENFNKWLIAESQEEMIQQSIPILKEHPFNNNKVLTYTIENSTEKILELFMN